MHIKEYLEKIVDKGKAEDMRELSHILDKVVHHLKECDPEWYNKICLKLYEMAYGKVLTLEMAEEWVRSMKPMAKYTKEETDSIIKEKALNVNDINFYAALNMICSDYGKVIGEDLDKYVEFTMAFLNDEDAKPDKLYLYWKDIVMKRQ